MKKRSPIFVFIVGFFTIFIYMWYWLVKTKGEMNKLGQKIPTAWIWLIPLAGSIWWIWKYSEAVEAVTNKELPKVLAFVVLYLLGPIGSAIIQDYFNKIQPSGATPAPNTGAPIPPPPQNPGSFTPTPPIQPPPPPPASSDQQPPVTPIAGV